MTSGDLVIERQTLNALEQASLLLQRIVANLYAEADNAVDQGYYNDASLLQSQADLLYEVVENLETVLAEQEE